MAEALQLAHGAIGYYVQLLCVMERDLVEAGMSRYQARLYVWSGIRRLLDDALQDWQKRLPDVS